MSLKIISITDDTLFLECDCGQRIACPSNNKELQCARCFTQCVLEDVRDIFISIKKQENGLLSHIEVRKNKVKNKFNLKYGNVEALAKKLKPKKQV